MRLFIIQKILRNGTYFDIYDVREEKYLPQSEVKAFAETHGLTYINTFYVGPFVSWEHVQSFMDHPGYGEIQEGIVIKNQTRLNDPNSRLPFVSENRWR